MKNLSKYSMLSALLVLVFGLLSFGHKQKEEPETIIEITTKFGVMKLKLYNETPIHRDNFIKLTNEDFFDSLLFHRVISNFMIQGGDPDSKNAPAGKILGEGGPGYDVPAEFNSKLYHKKGALAAARESDDINPEKKSSGSQFYIVQGRKYDSAQLANFEQRRLQQCTALEFKKCITLPENKVLLEAYMTSIKNEDKTATQEIVKEVMPMISENLEKYKYTPEQYATYETIGGTPHLDYDYTVFGEMIEGFDVLDSIAAVKKDKFDRPLEDVIMMVRVLD